MKNTRYKIAVSIHEVGEGGQPLGMLLSTAHKIVEDMPAGTREADWYALQAENWVTSELKEKLEQWLREREAQHNPRGLTNDQN